MTFVTQELSAEELKEMFSNEFISCNLNEDNCTVQMNFVENILSSNIKEIQSSYVSTQHRYTATISTTLHDECSGKKII